MNEDLARERASSAVDVEALTCVIDGGSGKTATRRRLQAIVEQDPAFTNENNMFMSRPERYRQGLRKARRFTALKKELNLSPEDADLVASSLNDTLPTFIHSLMFAPNVEALFTEQQREFWLPRCESMEVIGCYAQTELGHGSNIRALETTATFVRETDEFEINSPSITATKWWPGTMGRTANHAMVIAQLVIDGKHYGIHNFIVPIRGEDHCPLPGVRVGDIGPKIGFNTMDNGFCAFDRVRIPRDNMAMRHQHVDRDGVYTSTGAKEGSKIAYISMMQVRVVIAKDAGISLARAATIATRYSILRRQGFREGGKGQGEHQVLDYTIQMHRLLPLVAAAYGFHFTGQQLMLRLRRLEREHVHGLPPLAGEAGARDTLKQFHATSSCLKSMCTGITAAGIEDCRKACGGHGFLQSSGLPEFLGVYLQSCTVEGENHMLTQQVVRVLLQELATARKGGSAVGPDCEYIARLLKGGGRRRCPVGSSKGFRDSIVLEAALEHRAFRLLLRVEGRLRKDVGEGKTSSEAWNRALIEIYRASNAHACVLVFKAFKAVVDTAGSAGDAAPGGQTHPQQALDSPTCYALELLLLLLGLYWIQNEMGDFVEDGFLDGDQAGWVRDEVVEVLHLLRPMAVSLVDAWDLSDFQLNSALGRFDGRAYEALLETTERNPMNQRDPVEGYEEHLEPVIRGAREARIRAEKARDGGVRDKTWVAGRSPRAKL
ncbi:unnamed protein product [Scytosiphon promiscuus]